MNNLRPLGFFLAGAASVIALDPRVWSWPLRLMPNPLQAEMILPISWATDTLLYAAAIVAVLSITILGATRVLRREAMETQPNPDPHREALATMELLNAQILAVLDAICEQSAKNDSQLMRLDDIRRETDAAVSSIQVKRLVGRLAAVCLEATQDSRMLREKLSLAQSDTEALKIDLSKAKSLAEIDPLTGIANRRSFDAHLAEQVANHHASKLPVCLLLADIDHFKKINDTYGHQVGDMVIKHFAAVIAQSVRSTDFVARFGGEEFSVILPKASVGNALGVAERVRQSLAQTSWAGTLPSGAKRPTASFGIAEILDDETPGQLFERADRMLYSAKRLGRDRIEHDSTVVSERDRNGVHREPTGNALIQSEQPAGCQIAEIKSSLRGAGHA